MPRQRRDKVDANQKDIIEALEKIPGLTVEANHDDILLGYKGLTYWFEIKNPDEIAKNGKPYNRKRKTKEKQDKLDREWKGHYRIVWNIDQILEDIGVKSCQRPE